ncbi:MAG: 16S rRNA (cytidine(1402)-2'-O)-methyltransferase [Candidatus Moraniibacteriota bacterium]
MKNTEVQRGVLYIVATPIGNLGDITLRALEILKVVDAVLCEDTRVTGKLLARYEIRKSMVSCHEHTDDAKLAHIVERLKQGENLAFASDAGTPGLSDPGNKLVSLALAADIPVVPIPGVSALATIVSVAGIDMREFVFLGFPPHKKGRETFFRKVATMEYPVVYYESPHRVMKNLELLERLLSQENLEHLESLGRLEGKRVIIGRELTKMFEEVLRGTIEEIRDYFTANPGKQKGEFVVIIY